MREPLNDDENDFRAPEGLGPRILRRAPSPRFTIVAISPEDAWEKVLGVRHGEAAR